MITLTTPAQINSVLGGTVPVAYNKLVISPLTFDAAALIVSAGLSLTSTTNPDMQPITGSLTINTSQGKLQIEVPQLDFYRRITLSGPQIVTLNALISSSQNSVESGLISLGVIAGTQSTGA